MIGLVPMAGAGSRFVQEGYRVPKPFIPIMGQPMYVTALKSFPPADRFIFLCQKQFLERYPFEAETKRRFPGAVIIAVDGLTEGQACTCLLAEEHLDTDEPLLISSIDYQLVYDEAAYARMAQDPTVDVAIWTFQQKSIITKDPEAFAYCRTEGDRVVEVVEKQTISDNPRLDPAFTGTLYYRRARDFVRGAKTMIARNIRVNNEFYVGTSVNQLIAEGRRVVIFPVEKFVSFGDPLELQLFHAWEDFFYHEPNHPYSGWK